MLLELSQLYNILLENVTNFNTLILQDKDFLATVKNYVSLFEILFVDNNSLSESLNIDKDFRDYTENSIAAFFNSLNIIGKFSNNEKDIFKAFESFYKTVSHRDSLIIKALLKNNAREFVLMLAEKYGKLNLQLVYPNQKKLKAQTYL
jgi:hypothetical protein